VDVKPENPQAALIEFGVRMLEVIADTVVGYHKRLVAGGISDAVAGAMSQEFHTLLMAQLESANPPTKPGSKIGRR
jgi:hypothetical protein